MNKQLIDQFNLLAKNIKIIFILFNLLLFSTIPTINLAYSTTYINSNKQINNKENNTFDLYNKNYSIIETQLQRVKRQYYEDGYYNNYYGW